jgi:DNA-binding NarL/FixJ family response regulator
VVILTTYADDDLVFRGIRAGAMGYLLKDIGRAKLAEAVRGAVLGEAQIDPSIASKVLAEFQRMSGLLQRRAAAGPKPSGDEGRGGAPGTSGELYPIQTLTPREEGILQLLTEGLTNAGIAARLSLSEGTVKNYVSEILSKLHANDRTHAVVLAIRRGLLELE